MSDCVFCEIIARRQPALIVDERIDTLAIVPLNPVTPGHVIIMPKRHVADFAESFTASCDVMRTAVLLPTRLGVGDCNLITSRGAAATQSVFHLHVHLVPRTAGDGLKLPWSAPTPEGTQP